MRKVGALFIFLILLATLVVGCSSTQTGVTATPAIAPTAAGSVPATMPAATASVTNPTGGSTAAIADGKTLLETRCTACHTLARVVTVKASAAQWKQTVDMMIQRGAVLTPDEETVLVQYLADNFK